MVNKEEAKTDKSSEPKKEFLDSERAKTQDGKSDIEIEETQASAKEDFYGQLISLKAEFENYRKRIDREKPEWIAFGRGQLLEKLIPLYDVLLSAHEQILQYGKFPITKSEGGKSGPSKELVKGLEIIFKEFTRLFESEGVSVIDAVGQPFDFNKHEIMGQIETDEKPEGTVVEQLQRGYLLDGKTLRSAKVRVAKKK